MSNNSVDINQIKAVLIELLKKEAFGRNLQAQANLDFTCESLALLIRKKINTLIFCAGHSIVDGDDHAQTLFERIWKSRNHYDPTKPLAVYVGSVVRNWYADECERLPSLDNVDQGRTLAPLYPSRGARRRRPRRSRVISLSKDSENQSGVTRELLDSAHDLRLGSTSRPHAEIVEAKMDEDWLCASFPWVGRVRALIENGCKKSQIPKRLRMSRKRFESRVRRLHEVLAFDRS